MDSGGCTYHMMVWSDLVDGICGGIVIKFADDLAEVGKLERWREYEGLERK